MGNIFNKKRVIIALCILFAIALAAFSNSLMKGYFTDSEISRLKFQTGLDYKTAAYGKNVLLVNNEGARCINRTGKEEWSIISAMTAPEVLIEGRYIMLADISGKTVNVYSGEKRISQIKTESEILSAKMNKNGYVAVLTSELGFKGVVTVYDSGAREIFRWHSGNGYIGDMDLSDNGVLAVSQIMTDRERVYSRILKIDTAEEADAVCLSEPEGIFMKMHFHGKELVCVSESSMLGFGKNNSEAYRVDFSGKTLLGCSVENEHNKVLIFDSGLGGALLESYSKSGEKKGSYTSTDKIKAFDVSGEYIVIALPDKVLRLNSSGKVRKEMPLSEDIKAVSIFAGRRNAIVVGSGFADILNIR